jgi:alpha-glucosidase
VSCLLSLVSYLSAIGSQTTATPAPSYLPPIGSENQLAWWQRGAIYQIYPRSFADSDGEGVGDLPGVLGRLDHLVALGVSALWLSPFYRSPMADFGYDVSDYCDVDPVFGTLADFDALLKAAHERGLRVLVDWVPNHTSDRHAWFQESGRRHWYVWRDRPNGWRAQFRRGGSAWTRDEERDQWYLHSFLPQQPDLNWDEPEVEAAMHDVLRFWLDRGVDGFRMDVLYRIAKDPALGGNEGAVRHDQDWTTMRGRLAGIRRVLEDYAGDRVSVGELHLPTQADVARYLNWDEGLHLAHNFHFLELPWSAAAFRRSIGEFCELLVPGAWPAWCLNNHDYPRLATRHGAHAVRVAAMLLATLRGTPFLYQGEELGLADVTVPPDRVVDVAGRDPQRAPMPWEPPSRAGPGAGFTRGEPWLPLTPDAERVNAAAQAADPASVLALYRGLLAERRSRPDLQGGTMKFLDGGDADVLCYRRGDRHAVALNFSADARPVTWRLSPGQVVLSTHLDRDPGSPAPGTLRGGEGVLVETDRARS